MVFDITSGYLGAYKESDEVEEDQRSQDDEGNFDWLFHTMKSKYNCEKCARKMIKKGKQFRATLCKVCFTFKSAVFTNFVVPCSKRDLSFFASRLNKKSYS